MLNSHTWQPHGMVRLRNIPSSRKVPLGGMWQGSGSGRGCHSYQGHEPRGAAWPASVSTVALCMPRGGGGWTAVPVGSHLPPSLWGSGTVPWLPESMSHVQKGINQLIIIFLMTSPLKAG